MMELLTELAFPEECNVVTVVGRTNKLFPTTSTLLKASAVLPILTSPVVEMRSLSDVPVLMTNLFPLRCKSLYALPPLS